MPRISQIITDGKAEEVRRVLAEGCGVRTTAKRTGYTVSQVRSYRAYLEQEKERLDQANEDAVSALRRQNERLKDLLFKAQKSKPVEFDTLLRIEQRLAENIKTIASLSRDESESESEAEKQALERQISSLIKIVQEGVDECPKCRKAIRAKLGAFMKDAGK